MIRRLLGILGRRTTLAFGLVSTRTARAMESRVGELRHPDQTSVREAHPLVGIFAQQSGHVPTMIADNEVEPDNPALEEAENRFGVGLL